MADSSCAEAVAESHSPNRRLRGTEVGADRAAVGGRDHPHRHTPPIRRRSVGRKSVKVRFPVRWNSAAWPGSRLVHRVMRGRCKRRALQEVIGPVVIEPLLARLEARHDGMTGGARVGGRMLRRRRVTAADVATSSASSEVKPPPADVLTFLTSRSARERRGIDQVRRHLVILVLNASALPRAARGTKMIGSWRNGGTGCSRPSRCQT
jgi:hypothetical protein